MRVKRESNGSLLRQMPVSNKNVFIHNLKADTVLVPLKVPLLFAEALCVSSSCISAHESHKLFSQIAPDYFCSEFVTRFKIGYLHPDTGLKFGNCIRPFLINISTGCYSSVPSSHLTSAFLRSFFKKVPSGGGANLYRMIKREFAV